jgi:acyl-CoA thioesterase-1
MTTRGRLRVRVYGDSLALPRPGVVANEERYVALLEEWWRSRGQPVELVDRSRANQTLPEVRDWWVHDNAYFGEQVDVLIAHCGICDCAPRPLRPRERAWVSRLPAPLQEPVVSFVHRFRSQLVRARTIRVVPAETFRAVYRDWLPKVVQHARRTYVLTIAPTNADLELRSPGFGESIRRYNNIIRETVEELGAGKTTLIDVNRAILKSPDGIDAWVLREDGHHITPRTHRMVFEQLRDSESEA